MAQRILSADRKDFGDGRSFDASNADPLLGHGHQRLNATVYRFQPLSQRRVFPRGGDHQKRSEALEKHGERAGLHRFGRLMQGFHVFDDGSQLRGRDNVRRACCLKLSKDSAQDGNAPADFLDKAFVHPVEFVQDAPDPVHRDVRAYLFRPKNHGIEHVAGRLFRS